MKTRNPDEPATETPDQTRERRRFQRHPIRIGTSIETAGKRLACVALNFCREGMFLQVSAPAGCTSITLLLSPQPPLQSEYRLAARVVRRTDVGIGIKFREPLQNELFRWLVELSQAASSKGTQQPLPDMAQLVRFTVQAGQETLRKTLQEFHQRLDSWFIEKAEMAGNNREQTAFFEAIHQFDRHREALENSLLRCFRNKIDGYFDQPRKSIPPPDTGSSNLSLVDQSDFDDWLNMSESAARLESSQQEKLRQLEFLFSRYTDGHDLSTRIALCPTSLSECLRNSLNQLGIADTQARKAAYSLFTACLSSPFSHAMQKAERVFPLLESQAQTHSNPAHPEIPNPNDEIPQGKTLSAPPEVDGGTEQPIAGPGTPAPQGILPIVNHLLNPATAPQADEKSPALHEIEGLLHRWANAPESLQQGDILEQLQEFAHSSGRSLPCLDKPAQDRLQAAGRLTDALTAESCFAVGSRTGGLARLRASLLKLAWRQPDLLKESNPAVTLVNQIGKAEQLAGQDPALAKRIDQLSRRINEQLLSIDAAPLEILDVARQELEQLLLPIQQKRQRHLQRIIDGYEGRENINQSRLVVYQALHQRLGGKAIPEPIIELIEAGWYHLLVLTQLRHGCDHPKWDQHLAIIDRLLDWLTSDAATPLPEGEVKSLINCVDTELGPVCNNSIRHKELVQKLHLCLMGPQQHEVRKELNQRTINLDHFVNPDLLVQNRVEIPNAVRSLTVGEWIKILKEGKPYPYKLVWVGTDPPLYVFVDPSGLHKLELKPAQLALMLRNHSAGRIVNLDLPLLDRATDRVLMDAYARVSVHSHDPLTDLADRREFVRQLRFSLLRSGRPDEQQAICQLELEPFQSIISVCGQGAEEALLHHVVSLMRDQLPKSALPARLRENAFAILLSNHSPEDSQKVAQALRDVFSTARFRYGAHDFSLDMHIGLVPFAWGDKPDTIMINADAACLKAKKNGRNRIEIYDETDSGIEKEKNLLMWSGRINHLFEQGTLYLRCQQIAPLRPDLKGHYEILVGARGDDGTLLAPDEFIPAIEHFRRGPELDHWVIKNTLRWMEMNQERLDRIAGLSINLSGQSVMDPDFRAFLEQCLAEHQQMVSMLTFEITETAAIGNFELATTFIRKFKRIGCKFSLDDFGTGYASYAYLKHLDFDFLKIDGCFIKSILANPTDEEIVKSINHIGHSLGLKTIAEYVENEAIQGKIQQIGMDYAQGYGIARPVPLEKLWLDNESCDPENDSARNEPA